MALSETNGMTCRAKTGGDCYEWRMLVDGKGLRDNRPSVTHWLLGLSLHRMTRRAGPIASNNRHLLKTGCACATGLPEPVPGPVPRVITYQRKRANRRIVNEEGFIRMLREFGEVWQLSSHNAGDLVLSQGS